MTSIAWIGLGNMGSRMSSHLVTAGHEVRGFDVVDALREGAAEHGIRPVASVAEAVEGAAVVILSLPKGEHVRQVLESEDGVFAHAAPGTLILDTSTVDMETSQWCHGQAGSRGLRFVDAPVSGGTQGAQAGTLTFMLGGAAEDVADAKEVVAPMAGNVFAVGEATHGIAAKLVNNMMLGVSILAMSEGSQLANQLGLDPKAFFDVVRVSSGDSWAVRTWYPVPGVVDTAASNNDFAPTFTTELANKDIGLAIAAAKDTDTPLEIGEHVQQLFQRLVDSGQGGKDCSMIIKLVDGSLSN